MIVNEQVVEEDPHHLCNVVLYFSNDEIFLKGQETPNYFPKPSRVAIVLSLILNQNLLETVWVCLKNKCPKSKMSKNLEC